MNQEVGRWSVHYRGFSFSNLDGPPEAAPGGGVVGIGQEDYDVGILPHWGEHFYVFSAEQYGGWYGVDYFGLAQYIERGGLLIIKLGETVSTTQFKEFLQALQEDPLMPQKSAHYPWERRAR